LVLIGKKWQHNKLNQWLVEKVEHLLKLEVVVEVEEVDYPLHSPVEE
jgi:hypothetical protein